MTKSKCPFCSPKIEIAAFAEEDGFKAVYNLAPIVPGHCMIIPVKHIESIMELSEEELSKMVLFSRRIIKVLQKVFHTPFFNWTIQEGEPAGQSIPHLHMHLVPRTTGDFPEPGDWYPQLEDSKKVYLDSESRPKLAKKDLLKIVDKLKEALHTSQF